MSQLMSRALVVLCSSILLIACGGEDPIDPTTPSATPPPSVSEVFSGDINRNGATTHPFLAGAAGEITATLEILAPETVSSIGLSLGTWNDTGGTCQTIISNDNAAQGSVVKGATSIASPLCVRVYDVGKIPALASYQLTVKHP